MSKPNDLSSLSTPSGKAIEIHSDPSYYINESGLKIDAKTGELIKIDYPGPQCSPP